MARDDKSVKRTIPWVVFPTNVLSGIGISQHERRRVLGVSVTPLEAKVQFQNLESPVSHGMRGVEFICLDDHAGLLDDHAGSALLGGPYAAGPPGNAASSSLPKTPSLTPQTSRLARRPAHSHATCETRARSLGPKRRWLNWLPATATSHRSSRRGSPRTCPTACPRHPPEI